MRNLRKIHVELILIFVFNRKGVKIYSDEALFETHSITMDKERNKIGMNFSHFLGNRKIKMNS